MGQWVTGGRLTAARVCCATSTAAVLLDGGLLAGFFEPMGQDGLRVLGSPAIGEHFFPLGVVGMGSQENLAEILPRFTGHSRRC
jgi:hypothetical protein